MWVSVYFNNDRIESFKYRVTYYTEHDTFFIESLDKNIEIPLGAIRKIEYCQNP